MSETEYDSDRLTNDQILTILELASETEVEVQFQRLVDQSSEELLQEARRRLEANQLGLTHAARLLALNELTLKSWLRSSQPLPEIAHQKLAGLCLVLSIAEADPDISEAASLARAAVSAVKNDIRDPTIALRSESNDLILAIFDVAGLMAAALHAALNARLTETVLETKKPLE